MALVTGIFNNKEKLLILRKICSKIRKKIVTNFLNIFFFDILFVQDEENKIFSTGNINN